MKKIAGAFTSPVPVPVAFDVAVAVGLTIANVASILPYHRRLHPLGLAVLLVVVEGVPLVARRSRPVPTLLVVGIARVAYDLIGFRWAPLPVGVGIAVFTVADQCGPKVRRSVGVLLLAGIFVSQFAGAHDQPYDVTVTLLFFVTAWFAGVANRTRRAYTNEVELRARRAEDDQDNRAARAAADERSRIARELHDVVAHHVSLIAVQAEAAASLLPGRPVEAAGSVEIIGTTARQALTELRRLLGVLRSPDEPVETVPSASVDQLDAVVDQLRHAGLDVELTVSGIPRRLSAAIDLTAYRIVQEALTNAVRHAPANPVSVVLSYEPDHVSVTVVDAGDKHTPPYWSWAEWPRRRACGLRSEWHHRTGHFLRWHTHHRADAGRRLCGTGEAAGTVSLAGKSGPIRVLVADDQHLVRSGFCVILEAADDITVVGEAATGIEAIAGVAEHAPDVVLMDIRMPGMDGLEATRRLTAGQSSKTKVVILTTFDLDDYVYQALRAGASGFLLKDAPRHDLLTAVRVAASGDALLAPSVTRRLIETFARRPAEIAPSPSQLASLTSREHDILRLLAQGRTNAEIATELFVGAATVKTHVGHLLAKLGLRDRVQAVILAYETGIVRPGAG